MKNIWNEFISIKSTNDETSIWLNNAGDYNMFYGVQKPFSIEYLVSPDPLSDKIFNTLEYRLNDQFIDFNSLTIENWYQIGELNESKYSSNLKRRFNVNRIQIPRQSKVLNNSTRAIDTLTPGSLNRIRST